MIEDKQRWNEKYVSCPMPDGTSDILRENIHFASKGKALDIACGMGRNTHFLADNGFEVDAVDISDFALSKIRTDDNIHKIETDLDSYELEDEKYDLILKINYLDRRLFPKIIKALKKEGVFIYETFVKTATGEGYHNPTNPDFHLDRDELPKAFDALDIISYMERDAINLRDEKVRVASLVAKKP